MKASVHVKLEEHDLELIEKDFDRISVFVHGSKNLTPIVRRINKLTKGLILEVINSFLKKKFQIKENKWLRKRANAGQNKYST